MFIKSHSLSLSPPPLLTPTHSALTPTLSTSLSAPTLAHRPTVLPPAELPLQHSNSQHPHGPTPYPQQFHSLHSHPQHPIPGAPTPQHSNPISPHLQHHN